MRQKKTNISNFILSILLIVSFWVFPAYADVRIKILAVNPSSDKTETIPVKLDLPQEIRKDDILESTGLAVDYDVMNDVYYAHGSVELGPKESRTFQIVVKDKWIIPQEEIDMYKERLQEKLKALEKTDQYDTAKILATNIQNKLDNIIKEQNENAADVDKRVGLLRVNRQLLQQVDTDILTLEFLASKASQLEKASTIKYVVEANNPQDQAMETSVVSYLPKGVLPEYIVSNPGFDVKYDTTLGQYYLEKKENMQPNETKRFDVEIKDMWSFPETLLGSYIEEADAYSNFIKESKYKFLSKLLVDEIKKKVEEIRLSQQSATTLKDRMASFQANSDREAKVKEDIIRLKSLLAEIVKKQEFYTVLKETNPLAQLKIADIKKKVNPKVAVWTVVLYLVVFITIFAIIATAFWFKRFKEDQKVKLKRIEKPKEKTAQEER
jgi:hypothetical protein